MRIFILSLSLLLSACLESSTQGADGYTFGKPQYVVTKPIVEVIVYPSRREFEEEFNKRNTETRSNSQIVAFTTLYPADKTRCTIHIIDPAVEYSPEFVGHEFLHCMYGQWHTSNLTNG